MNYIVLEGFSLYLILFLILLLVMLSLGCLFYAITADKRNFSSRELLKREMARNRLLEKKNFILKLKHGELDTDD